MSEQSGLSAPVPAGPPPGRHLRRSKGRRALQAAAFALSAMLLAAAAFAAVQVFRLQSNVETQPLNLGADQEDKLPVDLSTDPVQILILGSDTRTGNSGEFIGGEDLSSGSGNSDVMLLVNLPADRSSVSVVSLPRDLLVPLPSCEDPETGEPSPAMDLGQLNTALNSGGPGCTVAAVNELTGLSVDHFMNADFNAVKELSKAVGGVEVCVTEPVEDEYSGLSLPAGTSEVEGDQALAFLRTRHGFGDGGDEGRIRAQQSFMASLARKVQEEGTLTNLPRLYSIAETLTKNLTVDEGLSQVTEILKLADRVKNVDLADIAFVTLPTIPWDQDPNRLVLDPGPAEELFAALREDRSLTGPEPTASASPGAGTAPASPPASPAAPAAPASPEAPAIDPASVPLLVVNGTDSPDRAAELQQILRGEGYTLANTLQSTEIPSTQVLFGPGYEAAAAELGTRFGIADVQLVPSAAVTGIELSVGADFASGSKVASAGLDDGLKGQTAEQATCQAASGL
ncbi:LCP family protein [Arthrobacter sp. MSA 4-2]|uniref:LCP family protein n=1 Tax=Arthrobacter sp. MSA 4-2 TaxID=2794349 RepID=UPI0018E89B26|nr:LCP family protein [Arthrobacter sp. MSA 4-2]MBJ2119834.1 LCP family protein [Arthrobacter sp. MSA 4-2]